MANTRVPDIVVARLPLYLRALTQMLEEGKEITSSQELGGRLGISSAQIRKDLSQFGEFGKQGTGYNIQFLAEQLRRILNVEDVWDIVLIGIGDLGRAIANYRGFVERGFRIVAIYDNDLGKIGQRVGKFTVKATDELAEDLRSSQVRMAMLAVPGGVAQEVTEGLVEAGIKSILCYAPTSLSVPQDVHVEYIDPVLHLQHMTYYLK